jgi:hypothetical protein
MRFSAPLAEIQTPRTGQPSVFNAIPGPLKPMIFH